MKEIDTFDINILTYFTFHLKRALILELPYVDFRNLSAGSFYLFYLEQFEELLEMLKSSLPEIVYEYYRKLVEYQKKDYNLEFRNLFKGFDFQYDKDYNLYASSESAYYTTKENLKETQIGFTFHDAKYVPFYIGGNYDIILLSNIADYFGGEYHLTTLEEFLSFINGYYQLLNENGVLIHYLYQLKERNIIKNSCITPSDLDQNSVYQIDKKEGYYLIRKK